MDKVIDIEEGKKDVILHKVSKLEPLFKRDIETVKTLSSIKDIKDWIKSMDLNLSLLSEEIQYLIFLNLLIDAYKNDLIELQDSPILLNHYLSSTLGKG